jgi:hypothetical protein
VGKLRLQFFHPPHNPDVKSLGFFIPKGIKMACGKKHKSKKGYGKKGK